MNINNKIKQFFGGNWGKPNKVEQKRSISKDFGNEKPKYKKKKKKKIKKEWIWEACPFCGKELRIESESIQDREWVGYKTKDECECGACKSVKRKDGCGCPLCNGCPCCGRETWYKDEIYKHSGNIHCGFEGKKRNV